MSPLILRLLNEARRDAFTYEIVSVSLHEMKITPMRAKPFTTPIKAFHIFRVVNSLSYEDLD